MIGLTSARFLRPAGAVLPRCNRVHGLRSARPIGGLRSTRGYTHRPFGAKNFLANKLGFLDRDFGKPAGGE